MRIHMWVTWVLDKIDDNDDDVVDDDDLNIDRAHTYHSLGCAI